MFEKNQIPWNKGTTGAQVAWNKGLTKYTDSRICGPKKYDITPPYEKNCPKCGKNMSYKSKYSLIYSMRDSKKCQSCTNTENNIGVCRKNMKRGDLWKKNVRLAKINRIKKMYAEYGKDIILVPAFNPIACEIIEQYGKDNGYRFQHALNGGEYHIEELGYWVDGYDKEKNTVIEIDEKHHFDSFGNLREYDIRRQNEIKALLNCEFIRIKV